MNFHIMYHIVFTIVRYVILLCLLTIMVIPILHHLNIQQADQISYHRLMQYYQNSSFFTSNSTNSNFINLHLLKKAYNQIYQIDNMVYLSLLIANKSSNPVILKWLSIDKNNAGIKNFQENKKMFQQIQRIANLTNKQIKTIKQSQSMFETIIDNIHRLNNLIELQKISTLWIILKLDQNQNILAQIINLHNKYPSDKFIIMTRKPIKNQNLSIKYQQLIPFNLQNTAYFLSNQMIITLRQAQIILLHYNKSLLALSNDFKNLDENLTLQALLGDQYQQISISAKSKQKIEKMCQTNKKINSKKVNKQLEQIGLIKVQGAYTWSSPKSKLNYEIQKQFKCGGQQLTLKQLNETNFISVKQNISVSNETAKPVEIEENKLIQESKFSKQKQSSQIKAKNQIENQFQQNPIYQQKPRIQSQNNSIKQFNQIYQQKLINQSQNRSIQQNLKNEGKIPLKDEM